MTDTITTLKHILAHTIINSQLLKTTSELDALILDTVPKLIQAVHASEQLLCEKEVSARWSFLSLTKLRNMRARGGGPKFKKFGDTRNARIYYKVSDVESWIEDQYQTEPFIDPKFRKRFL